ALALGGREVLYLQIGADGSQTFWMVPLAGGTPRQVWNGFAFAASGAASPDGTRAFAIIRSAEPGGHQAALIRLDGGQPQVTALAGFDRSTMQFPWAWTPDSKAITYMNKTGSLDNIWALPIAGGKPYALTHFTDLHIEGYAFAPDGRLVVSRMAPNADAVLATPASN
ncbi:MAG: TolB family protein, partial [Terriglobales bacterium]